jgi:hypothetical protein
MGIISFVVSNNKSNTRDKDCWERTGRQIFLENLHAFWGGKIEKIPLFIIMLKEDGKGFPPFSSSY